MWIYWLLMAVAVGAGIPLTRKNGKVGKLIYCGGIGVVLFLLAAVRRSTGYDYNLYASWYNSYNFMSADDLLVERMEKGIGIPMKIMTDITVDFQLLFVVISFVVAFGIMYYVYKNSEIAWISVAAFLAFGVYFNSLNFMRQTIAAIVIMYAIKYIKSNQLLRYIILILFAACFHYSALIMLPFFFILKIKPGWISYGCFVVITALCYFFMDDVLELITKYYYVGRQYLEKGLKPEFTIIFAVLALICFLLRKPLMKRNALNKLYINMAYFGFFFELMGTKYNIISRFALNFFIVPLLLLTPQIYIIVRDYIREKLAKDAKKKVIAYTGAAIIGAGMLLGVYTYFLATNYNGVVPYKTIFEEVEINE